MRVPDLIKLTINGVSSQRLRSFLTGLGIAVGIGAVVLLTSLGEGLHQFVLAEFTQFGTNLITIAPGKRTTHGISGAVISSVRPLNLEDAQALLRVPNVIAVVPFVQGNAPVEAGHRTRHTAVFGSGAAVPEVWRIKVAMGQFLPDEPPRTARAFAVLGSKLGSELFSDVNPLGQRLRIGGEVYRIVGVMESKGQMLGFDLDDAVYIPTAKALAMFNREGLMEIDLLYAAGSNVDQVVGSSREMLVKRHGKEDFTITTQEEMLKILGSVLGLLTMAAGALGSISLFVGGVGILTIMTLSVNERTAEIGLLRALGAGRNQIMAIFLGEAVVLAALGGLGGLVIGCGAALLLMALVPALPIHISWFYVITAELLATVVGLGAGVLPARRAAGLNPLEALRSE